MWLLILKLTKTEQKLFLWLTKRLKKHQYMCAQIEVFFYCKLETLALASFWVHSIFFSFAWLGNLLI